MKIQEIKNFDELISKKLKNDPENAFHFFKEGWKKLTLDDKKIFASYHGKFNPSPTYNPSMNSDMEFQIMSAYRSQIYEFINKELSGQPVIGHLKCGKGIRPIDITCVFKLLYDLDYLDNTLPEIEEIIIQVFNFKNRGTIESYLDDNSKLKSSAKKFKKLVDTSALIKE